MDSRALFEKFATAPDSSLHLSKAELCFAHPESKQRDHSHSMSRLKTRAAKESSKISDEDLNFVPPTNAFSFLAHAGGKAMLTPENREFSERTMQALPSTFIPEYSPRAAESKVESQQEPKGAYRRESRYDSESQPFLRSSSKISPRDDSTNRTSRHFVSRHSAEIGPALGDQIKKPTTSRHTEPDFQRHITYITT